MTNLKRIRKSSGLTQAALAESAKVNLRTLQDYEQGKKSINVAEALTVYKLAQALNCEVSDLLEL
jgi:transcriptional regulator with XRE-family HTH domain